MDTTGYMSVGSNSAAEINNEPKVIQKTKKLSKAELKKQKIYFERRQRLLNQGVSPEHVDNVIAKEDYAALPVDKKLARLEKMFVSTITEMAKDLNGLKQNDNIICDAIEINFRAIGHALTKAGIAKEVQAEILKTAEEEVISERKMQYETKQKEFETVNQSPESYVQSDADAPGEAPPPPEEATTFGG